MNEELKRKHLSDLLTDVRQGSVDVEDAVEQVEDMLAHARATPSAAQVQGEQPEVVGQLALDEPFNGTEGLEIGEWEFVPERAVVESMLAESTGEMVPLMTVAQHQRIVAGLEGERAEQWRLRRDFEARCDTQAAVIAELRAALSAPPAAGVPSAGSKVRCKKDLSNGQLKFIAGETYELKAVGDRIEVYNDAVGSYASMIFGCFLEHFEISYYAAPTPPASEVERLRAELEKCFTVEEHERLVAKGQKLNSAYISKLEQKLAEAQALLRDMADCPWVVEEATIPKAGVDAAPNQVVGTMHVGLARLRKIRAFLSATAQPDECQTNE